MSIFLCELENYSVHLHHDLKLRKESSLCLNASLLSSQYIVNATETKVFPFLLIKKERLSAALVVNVLLLWTFYIHLQFSLQFLWELLRNTQTEYDVRLCLA